MIADIDRTAPVLGRNRRFITDPIADTWTVLTYLRGWPRWQHDIAWTEPNEMLRSDLAFDWSYKGASPASSVVHAVERHRLIVWESTIAEHRHLQRWTFEPDDHGALVVVEESVSGPLPFQIRSDKVGEVTWTTDDPAQAKWHLDSTLARWLNFLDSGVSEYRDRQWSR